MFSGAKFLVKSIPHSLLVSMASLANSSHNLSGYLFAQLSVIGSSLLSAVMFLRRRLVRPV